jgi:hypothetical protein
MYSYRTVVHTNIKILKLFLDIIFFPKNIFKTILVFVIVVFDWFIFNCLKRILSLIHTIFLDLAEGCFVSIKLTYTLRNSSSPPLIRSPFVIKKSIQIKGVLVLNTIKSEHLIYRIQCCDFGVFRVWIKFTTLKAIYLVYIGRCNSHYH